LDGPEPEPIEPEVPEFELDELDDVPESSSVVLVVVPVVFVEACAVWDLATAPIAIVAAIAVMARPEVTTAVARRAESR
jgi:hypothetical protein